MKKTGFTLALGIQMSVLPLMAHVTDFSLKPVNDALPGSLSGHVRYLGMYRDYELSGYGQNSTLGVQLGYTSDRWCGFDLGLGYTFSATLDDGGQVSLLANDDVHLLNEGWLRYHFEGLGWDKTSLMLGRKITNDSIFRKDDFRQSPRSVESVQLQMAEFEHFKLTLGHALKMSNWIAVGDQWDFNGFGDVFGVGYDTDGLSWGEIVYSGFDGWEITLFDGYAWDVTNLLGTKVQYHFCDEASLIGYYRHESDVGRASRGGTRNADAYGLSYRQRVHGVTLEPGYFAVHGSSLRFNELTTGIDHPLGSLMMICAHPFDRGAQTGFLKATMKLNETSLYLLYNHTWHSELDYNAQELNVVVTQPVWDSLVAGVKLGVGYSDGKSGRVNETFSDMRFLMTWSF
jgi:hypothetical protein